MLALCILMTGFITKANSAAVNERCIVKSVFDLSAFAVDSITGTNLKSNGSLVAGAQVHLTKSEVELSVCRAISSHGNISLRDSKVVGSIESLGILNLINTEVIGKTKNLPKTLNVSFLKNEMSTTSKKYAVLKQTPKIKSLIYKNYLTLSLKDKTNVFSIAGNELEKIKKIELRAQKNQNLIVNVSGSSITLDQQNVDISGDIETSSIVWNFPEAKTLTIKNSQDIGLGFAGKILAPNATIKIENALISGRVFAKSIVFNMNGLDQDSELRELK
jgi:choice-of-anchor A domain-containing protein